MEKELFEELIGVIATLRSENGCPWDREQTHETLKSTLIEETYETLAHHTGDSENLKRGIGRSPAEYHASKAQIVRQSIRILTFTP